MSYLSKCSISSGCCYEDKSKEKQTLATLLDLTLYYPRWTLVTYSTEKCIFSKGHNWKYAQSIFKHQMNKPYVNGVNLREQNLSWKYC